MSNDEARVISIWQLVFFLSAVFALGSLGIDSMLPTLGVIARDLQLKNVNQAQLLITGFAAGMGLGSLLGGPLSDHHGRRPVILTGCLLYVSGALCAMSGSSLTTIFIARVVQGIGASSASVASTAWVRDMHAGPAMARIISFAMVMFAMMPAIAPFIGKTIASIAGWRAIFAVYALFGALLAFHVFTFFRETHSGPRSGFTVRSLVLRSREVLAIKRVRMAIVAQTLSVATLFSALSSIQPIFDRSFARADVFPAYFALMAVAIAIGGFVNGRIVSRVGSKAVVLGGLMLNAGQSLVVLLIAHAAHGLGTDGFTLFLFWGTVAFFVQGLSSGNLSALALEPVGHMAGVAASLLASIPMLLAAPIAMSVGLAFNGTPVPLELATLTFASLGCVVVLRIK
jgi:DHA1 family bicyclomycin/chloramphenicol resistance-like MFS transporter